MLLEMLRWRCLLEGLWPAGVSVRPPPLTPSSSLSRCNSKLRSTDPSALLPTCSPFSCQKPEATRSSMWRQERSLVHRTSERTFSARSTSASASALTKLSKINLIQIIKISREIITIIVAVPPFRAQVGAFLVNLLTKRTFAYSPYSGCPFLLRVAYLTKGVNS